MAARATPPAQQTGVLKHPGFWPLTISSAIVFVCLLSLGVWQLQRLSWKEGLIRDMTALQAAEPIAFGEVLRLKQGGGDIRFVRVIVTGEFLHDAERYYYRPDPKLGPGVDVFTPFRVADNQGLIVINRGFVPDPLKMPAQRREGLVAGHQEIVGLIRLPGEQGRFTPDNNPTKNLWYWRDFNAMTADVAQTTGSGPKLGLFVDAEDAAPGGWPRGGVRKIALSNRHFGYAVTWFGLAATLLGVYGVLIWGWAHKSAPQTRRE